MSFVSRYLDPNLVERLNHLALSARRVVEGTTTGQHRSPLKGSSVEFRQHRFYTPGDEPRRLDWRVLARTDRPYIKEYDEETNLRAMLMLDGSGSMGYGGKSGAKLDYAARFAAALAYLMLGQTESVGLALVGSKTSEWLKPHGGPSQLSRLIDVLERGSPSGPTSLGTALHECADRLDRRALVVVFSDLLLPVDSIATGLAHLVHDRHEVILLRVLDKDEAEFPFKNWSRFRGLEGERPQLCEPALMRQTYLDNFGNHRDQLKELCRAMKMECHELFTDRPLIDAVTGFLSRRAGK